MIFMVNTFSVWFIHVGELIRIFWLIIGGWETQTGHNTPVYKNDNENTTDVAPSFIKSRYNVNAAIQGYIAGGAPKNKLVMGLAAYGHGWQGKISINYILFEFDFVSIK